MKAFEKWIDRLYDETDFGRSIATSISGLVGLVIYLIYNDLVISIFSLIISFPIARIISDGIHNNINRKKMHSKEYEKVDNIYKKLTDGEKEVIDKFVSVGGNVLNYWDVEKLGFNVRGVDTLIERQLLWIKDAGEFQGVVYILDQDLFDMVYQKSKSGD